MKNRRMMMALLTVTALLFILAIYQVMLIFWQRSSEAESGEKDVQEGQAANMLKPQELYMTLGGPEEGSYARLTAGTEGFDLLFDQAYAVLERVLSEKAQVFTIVENELPWERERCVFSYDFLVESLLIEAQLENAEIKLPYGSWSEIWIMPSQTASQQIEIYLLHAQERQYLRVQGGSWEWAENQQLLNGLLQQTSIQKKEYLVSNWAWPGMFAQPGYVLEQTQKETAYKVTAGSAFLQKQEMNTERMQEYAMRFFEYPETVSVKEADNTMLFINEKMTVKLDASGRVQYVETLTDAEKEKISMKEAYQLAVSFLREDMERLQQTDIGYTFSGYEVSDDQYVFYFNYLIHGIPYRMEQVKTVEWRMKFPVKITVEGSKVRRYERYVMDMEIDAGSAYELQTTWLDAVGMLQRKNWELEEVPRLAYYLSGNRLVLQWEAETREGRAWTMAG